MVYNKSLLKTLLPSKLYLLLGRIKKYWEDKYNTKRSIKEVFEEIYKRHLWGLGSGPGSNSQPYVDLIIDFLKSNNEKILVDLGCGDFRIGRNFVNYCSKYIGVDIVPELIEKHKSYYFDWEKYVEFLCLDIIEDDLPDGDICLVRQVLQHLSNAEIMKILPKLQKYETVFITEHQPDICKVPNKDMVHGKGIRLYDNSGVYLDKSPFNVKNLELVLEVPGIIDKRHTLGIVRTYKIRNKQCL